MAKGAFSCLIRYNNCSLRPCKNAYGGRTVDRYTEKAHSPNTAQGRDLMMRGSFLIAENHPPGPSVQFWRGSGHGHQDQLYSALTKSLRKSHHGSNDGQH